VSIEDFGRDVDDVGDSADARKGAGEVLYDYVTVVQKDTRLARHIDVVMAVLKVAEWDAEMLADPDNE
jgi:hypothetical protein